MNERALSKHSHQPKLTVVARISYILLIFFYCILYYYFVFIIFLLLFLSATEAWGPLHYMLHERNHRKSERSDAEPRECSSCHIRCTPPTWRTQTDRRRCHDLLSSTGPHARAMLRGKAICIISIVRLSIQILIMFPREGISCSILTSRYWYSSNNPWGKRLDLVM